MHKKAIKYVFVGGVVAIATLLAYISGKPTEKSESEGKKETLKDIVDHGEVSLAPMSAGDISDLSFNSAQSFINSFCTLFEVDGCMSFKRESVYGLKGKSLVDSYVSYGKNVIFYMNTDGTVQSFKCTKLPVIEGIRIKDFCEDKGYIIKEVNNGFVIERK